MTAKPINILSADQVGDYSILLRFDDETEQTVNFEPFLSRSLHPDIHTFLDPVRFSTFRLEYGDLVWVTTISVFRLSICMITGWNTRQFSKKRPDHE